MATGDKHEYITMTVMAAKAASRPDGTTAIVVLTKESGPIALMLDQSTITTLRAELTTAEQFLHLQTGAAN